MTFAKYISVIIHSSFDTCIFVAIEWNVECVLFRFDDSECEIDEGTELIEMEGRQQATPRTEQKSQQSNRMNGKTMGHTFRLSRR